MKMKKMVKTAERKMGKRLRRKRTMRWRKRRWRLCLLQEYPRRRRRRKCE